MIVRPSKDQTIHGPPHDNQVPGPVSCCKGQTTLDLPGQGHSTLGRTTRKLPDTGQEPQNKGQTTLGRHPARVSARVRQLTSCRDRPGSDNPRAARQEARSAEQGSDTPHASRQESINPPVAGTGSLDPGSDNPRVANGIYRSGIYRSIGST
jgi:hypothetical protein